MNTRGNEVCVCLWRRGERGSSPLGWLFLGEGSKLTDRRGRLFRVPAFRGPVPSTNKSAKKRSVNVQAGQWVGGALGGSDDDESPQT